MPARESTRVNEASKLLRARYARSPKSCKILHGTSHRCPRRELEVVGADAGQLHTCALNCMCLGVGTPSQEMKTKPNQSEPNRTHASTGVASLLSCLLPHKSQPQKSIKPRCHLHRQQAGIEAERGKRGDRVYGVFSLSLLNFRMYLFQPQHALWPHIMRPRRPALLMEPCKLKPKLKWQIPFPSLLSPLSQHN